jgi:pimeloyl-ACP methyl ester carboxylesterase
MTTLKAIAKQYGSSGPWLTLIHGGLVAAPTWVQQVRGQSPNLADAARVLVVELAGYGSNRLPDEAQPASFEQWADSVAELWTERGIERSVVVGFSMGGFVAQLLAARHPDRVQGLVLTGTGAKASEQQAEAFRERAAKLVEHGPAAEVTAHLALAFSAQFRADQPAVVTEYGEYIAGGDARVMAAMFRNLAELDLRPALSRLRCPVQIICGEVDPAFGPTVAHELRDAIPGADLVVVPSVGHTVQLENGRAFNAAVELLLARACDFGGNLE